MNLKTKHELDKYISKDFLFYSCKRCFKSLSTFYIWMYYSIA